MLMKEEIISMTNKELNKLEIIRKVLDKRISQVQASDILSVTTRQIRRICKRYQKEGPKGLIFRKRGAVGNHKLPYEIKQRALQLIWSKYQDFGPTLAQEKLFELDHIQLSVGTVRNLMIENCI